MGKRTAFWLVIVLIISGFMSFYHLSGTPPGLYPDEAMNGNDATKALEEGDLKVFYNTNNGREGLYPNIQAALLAATGVREPWVLRFTSALFGFLTVLGVFFLTRELFHKVRRHNMIALLSAFFLATSFWYVNFSRIGFRAVMASFFLAWGLFFFLRSIRAQSGRAGIWLAVAGGALFGLGAHSYISYRVMPLLLLLFIPFFRHEKDFWRRAGVFVVAAGIVFLPLGLYFVQNPADFLGRTSQVSIFSSENPALTVLKNTGLTVGMLNFVGDGNWRHNVAGRPQLFWPVGIVFWIGVILAVRAIFRKKLWLSTTERDELPALRFAYLLCFGWIALATLPVVFSNEGIPHALRAILMVPPIMILAGAGAAWLYDLARRKLHGRHKLLLRVTGLVILSLLAFEGFYTYFVAWGQSLHTQGAFNANYVAIGRQIEALPDDTPKDVFVNAGGVTVAIPDPWSEEPRGQEIPVPAQTVMFITGTYTPAGQLENNLRYILPNEPQETRPGAAVFEIN